MLEQVMKLTDIIREQAEIIDAMFMLLLQHVSTEDESLIKITEMMEDAAEARALVDEPR